MAFLFPLVGLVSLAGLAGCLAGLVLQRSPRKLLTDVLQGICGAALCLEMYILSGSPSFRPGELIAVSLVGAWVAVGVAHATAQALRRRKAR
jgi:uncharacterized membrane protein YeaQ/YmgE (transglycosylase-associated protein family)